jgi:hypothetical protein
VESENEESTKEREQGGGEKKRKKMTEDRIHSPSSGRDGSSGDLVLVGRETVGNAVDTLWNGKWKRGWAESARVSEIMVDGGFNGRCDKD